MPVGKAFCYYSLIIELCEDKTLAQPVFLHKESPQIQGVICLECLSGLQGMLVAEQWIDRIARILDKPPEHIRELNFLKEGETTHFGQVMECSQVELLKLRYTLDERDTV